jgi:hypothetical protein
LPSTFIIVTIVTSIIATVVSWVKDPKTALFGVHSILLVLLQKGKLETIDIQICSGMLSEEEP